jgi:sarcosine oxidase gamma subunit
LNLFGGRHITSASLAALIDQSHGLKDINVNGCNALEQINLTGAEN